MSETIQQTEVWLKSVFNINKELDFERESIRYSEKRIKELEAQKEKLYKIVNNIKNPTYKLVLHKRYVQGKKWEEIEEELHYASQHIHRLHQKAIVEVNKLRTGQI